MAYPTAMDTHPSLPQGLWEQTPPEVRAYIVALEARVTALESMVQALQEQNRALQEQLNHTSRDSAHPTGDHRVPMAPVGVPGLRRDDTRALACGHSQWDIWPPCARHGGAV